MKLRLAKKVLNQAMETGDVPRGTTMLRAVNAFPRGKLNHPRKYWAAGLTAAFVRIGYSIHAIRWMIDSKLMQERIEDSVPSEARE